MSPRAAKIEPAADASAPALHDDVEEFLRHLAKERDVSPHTVMAYRRDLTAFTAFLGNYYGTAAWSWEGVDRLAMRGFLAHLNRRVWFGDYGGKWHDAIEYCIKLSR